MELIYHDYIDFSNVLDNCTKSNYCIYLFAMLMCGCVYWKRWINIYILDTSLYCNPSFDILIHSRKVDLQTCNKYGFKYCGQQ